jgi:hypothetical protein
MLLFEMACLDVGQDDDSPCPRMCACRHKKDTASRSEKTNYGTTTLAAARGSIQLLCKIWLCAHHGMRNRICKHSIVCTPLRTGRVAIGDGSVHTWAVLSHFNENVGDMKCTV